MIARLASAVGISPHVISMNQPNNLDSLTVRKHLDLCIAKSQSHGRAPDAATAFAPPANACSAWQGCKCDENARSCGGDCRGGPEEDPGRHECGGSHPRECCQPPAGGLPRAESARLPIAAPQRRGGTELQCRMRRMAACALPLYHLPWTSARPGTHDLLVETVRSSVFVCLFG